MHLAHSKAQFNEEYRGVADSGAFRQIAADEPAVHHQAVVHSWLSGRHKGLLANFAVGTIDQVLLMALRSRHLVLRHLGLAGKVVLLDEVHAADEYMSVYLDRALEWLGAYRVPVVMLSATLPGARRRAMVESYRRGLGLGEPAPAELAASRDYPLLTAASGASLTVRSTDHDARRQTLTVEPLSDDLDTVVSTLDRLLAEGGCAVVIRNTVGRAQAAFAALQEKFGDEVSLLHSRFVAPDRLDKEQRLLDRFGSPRRAVERPPRHIVVATQVVEQSLDVDFDLMVTDLAPIDLVLQRAGRLHRHARGERPSPVSAPRVLITGVDWSTEAPQMDSGSAYVYGLDALLRSAAVLGLPETATVILPTDIPRLVQEGYAAEYSVPAGWDAVAGAAAGQAAEDAHGRRRRAQGFLLDPPGSEDLVGWTEEGEFISEAKGQAKVRDGRDSIDVIVVQRRSDGNLYRWGADAEESQLPTEFPPEADVARDVSRCTVSLPPALSGPWSEMATITELEKNYFPGWQASPWLKEQLILVLDENCQCYLESFVLTYDRELGLTVAAREGAD